MFFPTGCLAYQASHGLVRPIRVRHSTGRQIEGTFIWSTNREMMAFSSTGVARLHLPGGCQIHWLDSSQKERFGVIERREADGEKLWSYRVVSESKTETVNEHQLAPLSPSTNDPLLLLRNFMWSSAGVFARRAHFQSMRRRWITQTDGMPGILGARIRPLPHQLAAVRRVLGEGSPRFLLADEVGLGKTIEAGLVLKALLHRDPGLRVLVVAPGAMSRQWLAELYLRFGAQVFKLLDQGVLQGLAPDDVQSYCERTLLSSRVVASASLLIERPDWHALITDAAWDAVVVDEAHRYQSGSALYPLLSSLARTARVFLALSATPSRNDLSGLQDLLRLVNPTPGAVSIERQLTDRKAIWFAVHNTRQLLRPNSGEDLPVGELFEALESLWAFVSESDPKISGYLRALHDDSDPQQARHLLGYVQDRYRMDHRLVRSRRQWVALSGELMPSRRLESFVANTHESGSRYIPDPAESEIARSLATLAESSTEPHSGMLRAVMERLCLLCPSSAVDAISRRREAIEQFADVQRAEQAFRRLFDDPEPALEKSYLDDVLRHTPKQPGEKEWLHEILNWCLFWQEQNATPARFKVVSDWISEFWSQKHEAPILVFAQESRVVKELAKHLRQSLGEGRVGEFHAERSQIELEMVARAFQSGGLKVLVSDELGGEGRNFQHADAVVHVDLPWSPSRVEQRIGRLDRIGRAAERDVLSVVLCGPSKLELSIFTMLRQTFSVFERTVGPIEFRLTGLRDKLSRGVAGGPGALEEMQPTIVDAIAAAKEEDEEVLDAALELSQDELEEGKELAEAMKHVPWQDWQAAASGWARELGIVCEQQVNGTLRVQVKPDQMYVDVTGVNPMLQTGIYGTFNRKEALANESIHLFGPGHPFVEGLELVVDKTWLGRACVWMRNLGAANGRVYVLFHFIYEPDFSILQGQKGRAMVELAILRHYEPGSKFVAFALPNGQHPEYEIVGQELVRQMRDRESSVGPITVAQLVTLGSPDFAYKLMLKIEEAQRRAVDWLREQRRETVSRALHGFTESIQMTIDVLKDRIEDDDGAVVARQEFESWNLGPDCILKEKITVEAIQLIFTPRQQVGSIS
jgi:ATP-dependent helicase HepA